jgi:FKBP-type peptidyl-prolyl cis-trans isomerase FkpA
MKRYVLAAAALLMLGACGNSVMDEMQNADVEARAGVEEQLSALSEPVQEDARTLPSGLEIQFIRRGKDQSLGQPSVNADVLVHYAGSFVDGGEEFDSSIARGEPAQFNLQEVVAGFREAITQMRPGDEAIATFPGALGYGPEGRGPIPPNAALRFRIILIGYVEPGGQPVEARP